MSDLSQRFKTLNRIDLFFLIAGLIECFCLAFIGNSKLFIFIGIVTVITAFIPIKEEKLKWNYFVGIWALLKYNPLSFAAIFFIISDLFAFSSSSYTAIMIVSILLIVTGLASLVLGIIVIVKTSRYLQLKQKA